MLDILLNHSDEVLAAVGGSAVLAALLPRPPEGSKWAVVFKLLDILAANWAKARNAK